MARNQPTEYLVPAAVFTDARVCIDTLKGCRVDIRSGGGLNGQSGVLIKRSATGQVQVQLDSGRMGYPKFSDLWIKDVGNVATRNTTHPDEKSGRVVVLVDRRSDDCFVYKLVRVLDKDKTVDDVLKEFRAHNPFYRVEAVLHTPIVKTAHECLSAVLRADKTVQRLDHKFYQANTAQSMLTALERTTGQIKLHAAVTALAQF